MVGINMEDVIGVLQTCKWYLVTLGVLLAVGLVVAISCHWIAKPTRQLVRSSTFVGMMASIVAVASLICLGPMSTLIGLTMGSSTVSEATTEDAKQVAERIAEEGFVLLKNDDDTLPLKSVKKLNLFGWASENPTYSGGGSGGINENYEVISLRQGLEHAGFSVNPGLAKFYASYTSDRPEMTIQKQSWTLPEPAISTYSDSLLEQAKAYSDVAVITLTRGASEGANDLPTDMSKTDIDSNSKDYQEFSENDHYLRLSHTERDLVSMVCKNFDKVVVLYNGANPMELGFLNEHQQIKAALWCAGPGHVGFDAVGKILSGKVNPSGRTTDTFVYDMTKAPYRNNAVKTNYSNMKDLAVDGMNAGKPQKFSPAYIDYAEGIYVGYKFYETAADEGAIDYDSVVQYPFGYGLSYTTFKQEMSDITEKNGELSFTVTVTNSGTTAGKDVVETYFNPPYTDGDIEKATANLIDEQKTKLLEPGESQEIKVSFALDDLASYDYQTEKAYVLDSGKYHISINADSHNELDSKDYVVTSRKVYSGETMHNGDKVAATNQFDDCNGDIQYLSRANGFANYDESTAAGSDVMSEKDRAVYHVNSNFDFTTYLDSKATMPITGAKNNLKLADLRGAAYDDERWDQLLDEMSVGDMVRLTSLAGYQTAAVDSIGKVKTNDADGPAAINNNFTGAGSIGFPVATVVAGTWNPKLVERYGEIMGAMAKEMDVAGWYAPGVNIHRTPFGGRNYEFYSEDGTLSGIMAVSAIKGAAKHGVYAYIKHFALYDGNAKMVSVWSNEQAIREIYLKPFEMGVKDAHTHALMVAWNYLGVKWVGECGNLLNTVLRDEWGFQGMAISDYFRDNGHGFMNADAAVANGMDAMLSTYGSGPNVPRNVKDASTVQYMRRASKNILYTVVGSWMYEEGSDQVGLEPWKKIVVGADAAVGVVLIAVEVVAIRRYRRRVAVETAVTR